MITADEPNNEQMAKALEQSEDYRIIRKYKPKKKYNDNIDKRPVKIATVLDFETTGKEKDDEPASIAMVSFEYDDQGLIYRLASGYNSLHQPSIPIKPEATAVNGLTDEMVQGHQIDRGRVISILSRSEFIIAHNASFDRYYFDRMFPELSDKIWCCSQRQINWKDDFDFDSQRQTYIALRLGFFYEEHQARTDCLALVEILSRSLNGQTVLSRLIDTLDKEIYYVSAHGSDFTKKDILKENGYLWEQAYGNERQVWSKAVADQQLAQAEIQFLTDCGAYKNKNLATVKHIPRKDLFKS